MSDPYQGAVVCHMHFDGADGATNFIDETGKRWITHGAAHIDASTGAAGQSGNFPAGDDVFLSGPDSDAWQFGLGDYTVEAFIFVGAPLGGDDGGQNNRAVFCRNGDDREFFLHRTINAPAFWDGAVSVIASQGVPTNAWTHVAWARQTGRLRIFVGGVKSLDVANSTNFSQTQGYQIGGIQISSFNTQSLRGNLDELRISKGVALYVDNFTPPAAPFEFVPPAPRSASLLHGQLTRAPQLARAIRRTSCSPPTAKQQYFGGAGVISGTVKDDATDAPLHRRVLLYDRRSHTLLRSTWSNPASGAYVFKDLDPDRLYYIVAHDYTGQYNAVIADNVTPEVA